MIASTSLLLLNIQYCIVVLFCDALKALAEWCLFLQGVGETEIGL